MQQKILFLILSISAISTFGSLYFSEVIGILPCNLCWYQRIFAYPIFIISLVAFIKKEYLVFKYIFFLALFGFLFALYHVLYENGIVPSSKFCAVGVDCSVKYVNYLGFITIPFLSLISFISIMVLCLNRKYLKFFESNKPKILQNLFK